MKELDWWPCSGSLLTKGTFLFEPRREGFCKCENKDADQLRGKREADQRLCFRYINSTIPLLSKYEITSFSPSSVAVQPGMASQVHIYSLNLSLNFKPRFEVFKLGFENFKPRFQRKSAH